MTGFFISLKANVGQILILIFQIIATKKKVNEQNNYSASVGISACWLIRKRFEETVGKDGD